MVMQITQMPLPYNDEQYFYLLKETAVIEKYTSQKTNTVLGLRFMIRIGVGQA